MMQERMDLHHPFLPHSNFVFVLWILVFALCYIIILRLHLIAYRLLSLLHSFTPEVTTLLSYTSYSKIYLILLIANTERTGDLLLLFVLIYRTMSELARTY